MDQQQANHVSRCYRRIKLALVMSSWHQALIAFTKRSRRLATVGSNHHNFLLGYANQELGGWSAPKEINLLPGIGRVHIRQGLQVLVWGPLFRDRIKPHGGGPSCEPEAGDALWSTERVTMRWLVGDKYRSSTWCSGRELGIEQPVRAGQYRGGTRVRPQLFQLDMEVL